MIARIATFEGGDADEMRRLNNELLVERPGSLPSGLVRVIVLMKDDTHWSLSRSSTMRNPPRPRRLVSRKWATRSLSACEAGVSASRATRSPLMSR